MARAGTKSKHRSFAIVAPAALLALLTIAAYWNSFDVPLVFDDLLTIRANSGVQFGDNLSLNIWATRPVLYLTFAINHSIHGQEVWGYHLVNVALHLLNGIFVFVLASNIFRRFDVLEKHARTYALLSAAFFILHPIQTESVTFISSRSELLSTAFYGLAVLAFVKRDESKIGFLWSFVVAVPFALGIFAKETVISVPAVLVAYDFLFLSNASVREMLGRWRFYITFIAGGVFGAYFLLSTILKGAVGSGVSHMTAWEYFLTQLRVNVTYLRLLVLPTGLNLDYDYRRSTSLFEPSVLASLVFLAGLLGLAWYLRKRQPVIAFSIFWFFITLAPTSSFVPIADVIFEHRMYLPLVGVCFAFPLLIDYLAALLSPRLKISTVAACTALLLVLGVGAVIRNQVWRSELTLWNDVIAKSPHKARPYNSLAMVYFNRHEFSRALEVARRGVENVSNESDRRGFQQTIGKIYIQMHRYEDAAEAFREATRIEDKREASAAYNNIGVVYVDMAAAAGAEKEKLLAQAAEAFRKSSDLDDSMLVAFDSYVNVQYQISKKDDLTQEFQSAIDKTNDYRAHYGLGKVAFLSGDFAGAVQHFDEANRRTRPQKLLLFHEAYALNQLKRRDEAIEKYLQTIRVDPLFVQARHNLALLYMQTGDSSKAIEGFENVLRLDSNYLSAHLNLAKIYIQMGNLQPARNHLSKVLDMSPQQAEALALLRQMGS